LSTLVQFVNRNGETGNRELGSIQDGGVQDDLDEMSNDEILEFSQGLDGVKDSEQPKSVPKKKVKPAAPKKDDEDIP
jgi:hypothetical protein